MTIIACKLIQRFMQMFLLIQKSTMNPQGRVDIPYESFFSYGLQGRDPSSYQVQVGSIHHAFINTRVQLESNILGTIDHRMGHFVPPSAPKHTSTVDELHQ